MSILLLLQCTRRNVCLFIEHIHYSHTKTCCFLYVMSGVVGPVARDSHTSVMPAVTWHISITANACGTWSPS